MERPSRHKAKNKKQPAAKQKTAKKRKSDGPTCSMFLAELTRKLAAKRREELELPTNIIQSIIESITNALPIKILIKSAPSPPPIEPKSSILEELCSLSPELVPNDTISIIPRTIPVISNEVLIQDVDFYATEKFAFKMPKMPVVDSEIMKTAAERETRRRRTAMIDAATTTAGDHDVASELTRHVATLRKISLIAEEFNQKTAKSLKEIVDSVQEDLIKKLEEVQAEQRARAQSLAIQEAEEKVAPMDPEVSAKGTLQHSAAHRYRSKSKDKLHNGKSSSGVYSKYKMNSKVPRIIRSPSTQSNSNKSTDRLSEKLDNSGDNKASTSRPIRLIAKKDPMDRQRPSYIPRRKITIKESASREKPPSIIPKKKEPTNFLTERNIQRVQMLINQDYFPEEHCLVEKVARPIPTLGNIYARVTNSESPNMNEWFVTGINAPSNSLASNILSIPRRQANQAKLKVSSKEIPLVKLAESSLSSTASRSKSLSPNRQYTPKRQQFDSMSDITSDFLASDVEYPTRDNEIVSSAPRICTSMNEHKFKKLEKLASITRKSTADRVDTLIRTAAKLSMGLDENNSTAPQQPTIVLANVTPTLVFAQVSQRTDVHPTRSHVETQAKKCQYSSNVTPPHSQNRHMVPSYEECFSEILQKTTNFEGDGYPGTPESVSSLTTTDLDIRDELSSECIADDGSVYGPVEWCLKWGKSTNPQSKTKRAVSTETMTADSTSYFNIDSVIKIDRSVIKSSVYKIEKLTENRQYHTLRKKRRKTKGNAEKWERFRRFPSCRYKDLNTISSIRGRTSLRIGRRRFSRVWKKTTDKWIMWSAKPPQRLKKRRIMRYLQRITAGEDADMQTSPFKVNKKTERNARFKRLIQLKNQPGSENKKVQSTEIETQKSQNVQTEPSIKETPKARKQMETKATDNPESIIHVSKMTTDDKVTCTKDAPFTTQEQTTSTLLHLDTIRSISTPAYSANTQMWFLYKDAEAQVIPSGTIRKQAADMGTCTSSRPTSDILEHDPLMFIPVTPVKAVEASTSKMRYFDSGLMVFNSALQQYPIMSPACESCRRNRDGIPFVTQCKSSAKLKTYLSTGMMLDTLVEKAVLRGSPKFSVCTDTKSIGNKYTSDIGICTNTILRDSVVGTEKEIHPRHVSASTNTFMTQESKFTEQNSSFASEDDKLFQIGTQCSHDTRKLSKYTPRCLSEGIGDSYFMSVRTLSTSVEEVEAQTDIAFTDKVVLQVPKDKHFSSVSTSYSFDKLFYCKLSSTYNTIIAKDPPKKEQNSQTTQKSRSDIHSSHTNSSPISNAVLSSALDAVKWMSAGYPMELGRATLDNNMCNVCISTKDAKPVDITTQYIPQIKQTNGVNLLVQETIDYVALQDNAPKINSSKIQTQSFVKTNSDSDEVRSISNSIEQEEVAVQDNAPKINSSTIQTRSFVKTKPVSDEVRSIIKTIEQQEAAVQDNAPMSNSSEMQTLSYVEANTDSDEVPSIIRTISRQEGSSINNQNYLQNNEIKSVISVKPENNKTSVQMVDGVTSDLVVKEVKEMTLQARPESCDAATENFQVIGRKSAGSLTSRCILPGVPFHCCENHRYGDLSGDCRFVYDAPHCVVHTHKIKDNPNKMEPSLLKQCCQAAGLVNSAGPYQLKSNKMESSKEPSIYLPSYSQAAVSLDENNSMKPEGAIKTDSIAKPVQKHSKTIDDLPTFTLSSRFCSFGRSSKHTNNSSVTRRSKESTVPINTGKSSATSHSSRKSTSTKTSTISKNAEKSISMEAMSKPVVGQQTSIVRDSHVASATTSINPECIGRTISSATSYQKPPTSHKQTSHNNINLSTTTSINEDCLKKNVGPTASNRQKPNKCEKRTSNIHSVASAKTSTQQQMTRSIGLITSRQGNPPIHDKACSNMIKLTSAKTSMHDEVNTRSIGVINSNAQEPFSPETVKTRQEKHCVQSMGLLNSNWKGMAAVMTKSPNDLVSTQNSDCGYLLSPKEYEVLYKTTRYFSKEAVKATTACKEENQNGQPISTQKNAAVEVALRADMRSAQNMTSPMTQSINVLTAVTVPAPSEYESSTHPTPCDSSKYPIELPTRDNDAVSTGVGSGKNYLAASCRYYSSLLTKHLDCVKENFTKHLAPATDSSTDIPLSCEACTMKPSAREEFGCQTFKGHAIGNSTLDPTENETNICRHDKQHLQSVYYMLTAIEGRLRRLKSNADYNN